MPSVTFITHGTRGDVEPLLAQALNLHEAGYKVCIAGPMDFKNWVVGYGIDYVVLGNSPVRDMLHSAEVQGLIGYNPLKIWRALKHFKSQFREIIVDGLSSLSGDTDLIVAHASLAAASDVACAFNVPLILLSPIPFVPTSKHPNILIPFSLGPFNSMSHWPLRFVRLIFPSFYKELRQRLGLHRTSLFTRPFQNEGGDAPILHMYSPALLARPDDWRPNAEVIGYCFLDHEGETWQPSDDLLRFLAAGPPPIYIGFGSMVPQDPVELSRLVTEAVQIAGVRAIIGAGWAALSVEEPLNNPDVTSQAIKESDETDKIFVLDSAPHHKLFPLCQAVVHHGGAGTTAAGLRAGKPSLICPFGFDQPFWGRVIYKNQLGPKPIALKKLTASKLAAALSELTSNPVYKDNAGHLAEKIALDRPNERFLALVEAKIGRP